MIYLVCNNQQLEKLFLCIFAACCRSAPWCEEALEIGPSQFGLGISCFRTESLRAAIRLSVKIRLLGGWRLNLMQLQLRNLEFWFLLINDLQLGRRGRPFSLLNLIIRVPDFAYHVSAQQRNVLQRPSSSLIYWFVVTAVALLLGDCLFSCHMLSQIHWLAVRYDRLVILNSFKILHLRVETAMFDGTLVDILKVKMVWCFERVSQNHLVWIHLRLARRIILVYLLQWVIPHATERFLHAVLHLNRCFLLYNRFFIFFKLISELLNQLFELLNQFVLALTFL